MVELMLESDDMTKTQVCFSYFFIIFTSNNYFIDYVSDSPGRFTPGHVLQKCGHVEFFTLS